MKEGKAYIESGILELYVLGELNAAEQREVEAMAAKYPEVKKEITAIELAMEQYAMENAIAPSAELESIILGKITPKVTGPSLAPLTAPQEPAAVSLAPDRYESKIRTLKYALAACATLLLVTGVALYSAHTELDTAKNQIIALNQDKQRFAATVNYMTETNKELQTIADMPADPDWKIIRLAGTKMDPEAKMTVYWHTSGRHVMLDNSKMALPKNDDAHQYQLWALVKGKPVDLGVFDVKTDSSHILLKMKEIAGADAFAVTLEKRGGAAGPTMDQMIAMGGV
ncbi:anti-sigma factor [Pedobacter sp. PLR]|uniref:anti-sigma factor n=1 Tax=Pedobacter sp. PLR TaxID=2994465 RepID=UPI002247442C|nr:anti-sigma factor [Pedobacter sp. PLR]MCX2450672.1 anti-sigma factor [Pedobacter sp. PLR]